MTVLVTVVSFLIVLSIVVLVHELGHFVIGRWAGARVEEFALGFPPRLWSIRWGETDYSINAVPLGGYCRFAGEDNPNIQNGLASLPRSKRGLVLVAGVVMNAILAIILFAAVYATGFPTAVPTEGIRIAGVVSGAPADQAGLKSGDIILKLDGVPTNDLTNFSAAVRSYAGRQVDLLVRHTSGQETIVRITPRVDPPANEGPMGIIVEPATVIEIRSYPIPQALWMGVKQTGRATMVTFSVPVMILRGLLPADVARPVGPIGIGRIVGSAAEAIPSSGFAPIFLTTAFLSISLAIVNILPLPGLDGGRLLFLAIEWLRGGKRLNPEREAIIHLAGLVFLMSLMVIVTYFDIVSPVPTITWGP